MNDIISKREELYKLVWEPGAIFKPDCLKYNIAKSDIMFFWKQTLFRLT